MTTFRVHFTDGTKREVEADNPDEAAKLARRGKRNILIFKIKKVK